MNPLLHIGQINGFSPVKFIVLLTYFKIILNNGQPIIVIFFLKKGEGTYWDWETLSITNIKYFRIILSIAGIKKLNLDKYKLYS